MYSSRYNKKPLQANAEEAARSSPASSPYARLCRSGWTFASSSFRAALQRERDACASGEGIVRIGKTDQKEERPFFMRSSFQSLLRRLVSPLQPRKAMRHSAAPAAQQARNPAMFSAISHQGIAITSGIILSYCA